jgi:hypothetical protein
MKTIRQRHLPHWDFPGSTFFVTTCLAGSIPAQGLLEIEQYRDSLLSIPPASGISVQEWKKNCWKKVFVQREKWLDDQPAVRHLSNPELAKIVTDSIYYFAGERYDLLAYVVMPSHFHWLFHPVGQICNLSRDDVEPICNKSKEVPHETATLNDGLKIDPRSGDRLQICPTSGDRLQISPTSNDRLQICPTSRSPREKIMQSIKRYSARICNQLLKQSGTFWQDESHDHIVRDAEEMERIIQYIEDNPVKAGLAKTPEQWPFSSARDRIQQNIEFGLPLSRP